jgi:hypothetical protein
VANMVAVRAQFRAFACALDLALALARIAGTV